MQFNGITLTLTRYKLATPDELRLLYTFRGVSRPSDVVGPV